VGFSLYSSDRAQQVAGRAWALPGLPLPQALVLNCILFGNKYTGSIGINILQSKTKIFHQSNIKALLR